MLYSNADGTQSINKSECERLLSLAIHEYQFLLKDILYRNKNGMAIGWPLELFLSFYDKLLEWLEQCPSELKPVFDKRYVDDIFVLFESAEHHSKFHTYLT